MPESVGGTADEFYDSETRRTARIGAVQTLANFFATERSFMNRCRFSNGFLLWIVAAIGGSVMIGCGGSTSTASRFQQMAEARAARNRADKQEEAEQEAKAKAPAETKQVQLGGKPPTDAADNADKAKTQNEASDASPANPLDTNAAVANSELPVAPESSDNSTDQSLASKLPDRKEVMQIAKGGAKVAYAGESKTIGVYDVKTKSLIRKIYNPHLDPFSIAISEKGNRMVVGSTAGSFKVFSLESIDGLDRFQQTRLRRKDASLPRKAHDSVVTAVAVHEGSGLVATGDADGVMKVWADDSAKEQKLLELETSDGAAISSLLSYQNDEAVFAVTPSKVVFWSVADGQVQASDFSNRRLPGQPTLMIPGAGGKGLTVGDQSGVVTQWTPAESSLQQSYFRAHDDAVQAIGYADQGRQMVTVSSASEVGVWSMPMESQQEIKLVQAPRFVTTSVPANLLGVPSRDRNLDLYSISDASAIRRHVIPGNNRKIVSGVISQEGNMVGLAADSSDVFFQTDQSRTVASMRTGHVITEMNNLPDEDNGNPSRFVFQTRQGTIGVATYPGDAPRAITSQIATPGQAFTHATAPSGSVMVTQSGANLIAIDLTDGAPIGQCSLSEVKTEKPVGDPSAIAVENDFAIVGTSTGDLLRWNFRSDDDSLEVLQSKLHAAPVQTLGINRFGDIWSCDNSGKTVQTVSDQTLDKQPSPVATNIAKSDDGKRLTISNAATKSERELRFLSPQSWKSMRADDQGVVLHSDSGDSILVEFSECEPRQHRLPIGSIARALFAEPTGPNAAIDGWMIVLDEQGKVWQITQGLQPVEITAAQNAMPLCVSEDGKLCIATENQVQVLQLSTATIKAAKGDEAKGDASNQASNEKAGLLLTADLSGAAEASWRVSGRSVVIADRSGKLLQIDVPDSPSTKSATVKTLAAAPAANQGDADPRDLANPSQRFSPGELWIAGERVLLVDRNRGARVIDLNDGSTLKSFDAGSVAAATTHGETLFLANQNGTVVQFDVRSNTAKTLASDLGSISSLHAGDSCVAVVSADGKIHWVDSEQSITVSGQASAAGTVSMWQNNRGELVSINTQGQIDRRRVGRIAKRANAFAIPSSMARISAGNDVFWTAERGAIRMHGPDGNITRSWQVSQRDVAVLVPNPIETSAFSIDADGQLTIVGTNQGSSVRRITLPGAQANSDAVTAVWSTDGRSIAVVTGKRVVTVDSESSRIAFQYGLPSDGWEILAWTGQGLLLADPKMRLMKIQPSEVQWSFQAASPVRHVIVDETGQQIVALDEAGKLIRLATDTGKPISEISVTPETPKSVTTLIGTGSTVVLDSANGVYLIDDENQIAKLDLKASAGLRQICGGPQGRRLFASTNDNQVLVWSIDNLAAKPGVVPCSVADRLLAVGQDQLLATSTNSKLASVVSASSTMQIASPKSGPIIDASVSADGSLVAMVDGTSTIKLVPAAAATEQNAADLAVREESLDDYFIQRIAFNPNASHLLALAESKEVGGDHHLLILDARSAEKLSSVQLSGNAKELRFCPDGSVVLIRFEDGSVDVYESSSGVRLESVAATAGLQTASFSEDATKLLLAYQRDGQSRVRVQPLSSLGQVKSGPAAIVSLSFHNGGKYILSGDMSGKLTLWNRASLIQPLATFVGTDSPMIRSSVSPDGRYVSAVYEDPQHSVYVWDMQKAGTSGDGLPPSLITRSEIGSTSAAFTSDSKFLLIGASDGMIRAWSMSEDREVARFKGHSGPVVDIAARTQPDQFVSGGSDKSIRSWAFPTSLPVKGAAIPQGALADSTTVENVPIPENTDELDKIDPFDAARQALISGAKTADVLSLMNVSDKIKFTMASVMQSEKNRRISAKLLSQQRRQLAMSQADMLSKSDASNLSTFADGFSNLSFVGSSNFKFGLEKRFRPVQLLFSDRFLYAARPSDATRRRKPKDGEPEIDYGDNGALLSWDFKYSRLQAHAWSIEDLKVRELVSLPDSAGVLTVPQMMLFAQDGSSRLIGNVATWSVSQLPATANQFLAVGSAGAIRKESDILTIFNINELSKNQAVPYSQYRSYEGVVTAMAFANNSPYVAFCVRERAVHRLFIADTHTMELRKLEEVNHSDPWLESDDGNATARNSEAIVGINALAFSPDDKMLVAHGQYDDELHKFSRWDLAWEGSELIDFRKSRKELESDTGPFFDDGGNDPIRFMSRPIREDERDPDDPHWQSRRTAGSSPKIIVRNRKGFHVVNLNSARAERIIPYLTTQHGVPQHDISDDGRWLVMGDDNGKAILYDLDRGDQFSVTIDPELESAVADPTHARPEIRELPAHSGPVVGVAFSKADPGQDYPAFVATFGEENKVKVWEMYPILDPEGGLRSRHWVDQVKPERLRPVKTRRRSR